MLVTSVLLYLSYNGMLVALWPFAFIKCVCVNKKYEANHFLKMFPDSE